MEARTRERGGRAAPVRGRGGPWTILAIACAAAFASCDASQVARRPDSRERPAVVLVTLDTTRADRLGTYGYERATTPNLDQLAADGVVYLDAVSSSSWTLPSHASMLTGKYPVSHGARFDAEGPLFLSQGIRGRKELGAYRARGLASDEVTLPQLLAEQGYATGAIVGGPWMKRVFGLGVGFDYYDDSLVSDVVGARAEDVTDRALAWVPENQDTPFFLFLNYYDPHGPFMPPLGFRIWSGPSFWFEPTESGPETNSLYYDLEIEYTDQQLGRVFDMLRGRGLYDDALIIVTADHGELLGEHGKTGHGKDLTQQELHVPLIVKLPGGARAGERVAGRVSNTGVFSLVLERVGIGTHASAQAHIPALPGQPIVAETYPLAVFSKGGAWRALFDGSFKLVWNSRVGYKLYDLDADPSERANFAASYPETAASLQARLEGFLATASEPGDAGPVREIAPDTLRALENLGYLE